MSSIRPMMNEVKLTDRNDSMEKLADLYGIIRATDALETAYSRDAVKLEEYKESCSKLISQFKLLEASLITSRYIDSADNYFKLNKYDINYAYAYNRLVKTGVPQNMIHPVHDARQDHKSAYLEMGAAFVTALDVLRMYKAKDEVHPQIAAILEYVGKLDNIPPDFDGVNKLRKWIEILNQMRASDSLTEEQIRDLIFDVESTYDTIKRSL